MPHDGIFVNTLEAIRHGQGKAVARSSACRRRSAAEGRASEPREKEPSDVLSASSMC
jgi:hypothetical protein